MYLPNCICMKCDNKEGLKPDFAVPKVGHMHGVTNVGVLNDGICVWRKEDYARKMASRFWTNPLLLTSLLNICLDVLSE